jgi:hypothetical protein
MCIPFPNPAVQKAFLPSLNKAFTKAQRCAKKKWEKKKKENQHSEPNIYGVLTFCPMNYSALTLSYMNYQL